MRSLRPRRLSKLSRATSSPPELLKIQQWCGQVLSRPGSATAQVGYILSGLSFQSWRECSHSGSSFPAWHSTACCCCCCFWRASLFPRSAALAGPPRLCPVLFLWLDLLQTHSWQRSPERSRGGFLFRSVPGRFSMNRKGGQGPTGRSHRNSSAWFSYEQEKGRHAGPRHLLSSFTD